MLQQDSKNKALEPHVVIFVHVLDIQSYLSQYADAVLNDILLSRVSRLDSWSSSE